MTLTGRRVFLVALATWVLFLSQADVVILWLVYAPTTPRTYHLLIIAVEITLACLCFFLAKKFNERAAKMKDDGN